MLHRAFHKIKNIFIYDLVKKENGILIGRVEGTEQWVACKLEHLVIEQHTMTYDVNHRPIFEEDVLRDKNNNRYRVVYQGSNGLEWSLYHIESRTYFPLMDMQRYEVIGNRHMPFQQTQLLMNRPFIEEIEILCEDVVLETPKQNREIEAKASVSEIINENMPSKTVNTLNIEEKTSLIPSFLSHSRTLNRNKKLKRKKQWFFNL